jgi:hypothetical protein
MGMVQVTVHEVVNVVAMGNGLVPTVGAVHVVMVMTGTVVCWGARGGVDRVDIEGVLVDMVCVDMVKVAIVQVVDMVVVPNRCVPTALSMRVLVVWMLIAVRRHGFSGSKIVFSGVLEGVVEQLEDVFIGQGVVDVLAGALSKHEPRLTQNLHPL